MGRPVAACVWLILASALPAAAGDVCRLTALPGLTAARARIAAPAPGQRETPGRTALRAAALGEFLVVASAVTQLDAADAVLDAVVRDSSTPLPCDRAVRERDHAAFGLLMAGYSARELSDIVGGRLGRHDVDAAQRLLMAGHGEAEVAAYLERAMARRRGRHASPGQSAAPVGGPVDARVGVPIEARRPADRLIGPRMGGDVDRAPTAVGTAGFVSVVERLARRHGVDPRLVHAIIAAESAGDPGAVSRKGAVGLMQLMPATARMLGVNPADPHDNLRGGVTYLAGLIAEFGNARDALIAYNAGPSHAQRVRRGAAVLYGETRRYLDAVARRYPL